MGIPEHMVFVWVVGACGKSNEYCIASFEQVQEIEAKYLGHVSTSRKGNVSKKFGL
jgi:hypothetical protein